MVAAYCQQPDFLGNVIFPLLGTAFSFMVAILALAYMSAQLFKKPEYEGFVSIEIHQLLVSALLMGTVFGAAYFSCEMADALAGGDMFQIGSDYLNGVSNNLAVRAVLAFEYLKLFSQYWGSMTFRWGATVWGVGIPSFPAFIIVERVAEFLLMLITPFSASLSVQQIILETIKATAIPFVLPAGTVLRIFPPTRDAGAFLISAALGFQLVYPFTYVMHKNIVEDMIAKSVGEKGLEETLQERGEINLSLFALTSGGLFNIDSMLWSPIIAVSFLLLQALFLPALSMLLTITFIKGFSKFLNQKM